jgi:hypothetical protein
MSVSNLVSTKCDTTLSGINEEKLCYRCKKPGHYAWQCNKNFKNKLRKIMDMYDFVGFQECEKLGSLTPGYIRSLIGKPYPIKVFNYLKRWNRYHGNMPGIAKAIDDVIRNIWRKHDLKYKNYNRLAKAMSIEEKIESNKLNEVIKQVIKTEVTKDFAEEEKEAFSDYLKRFRKETKEFGREAMNWDPSCVDKKIMKLAEKKKKEMVNKEQKIIEVKKGITQDVMERALEEDELDNERAEAFRLKKDLQKKKKIENKFFSMLKNVVEEKRYLAIHTKLNELGLNMNNPRNLGYVADQVISILDNKLNKINKFVSKLLRDRAVLQLCINDYQLIEKENEQIEKEIDEAKLTKKGLKKDFMKEKSQTIIKNENDKVILASKIREGTQVVNEKENEFRLMIDELHKFMQEEQLGTLIVPDSIDNNEVYRHFQNKQQKQMKGVDIEKYKFGVEYIE